MFYKTIKSSCSILKRKAEDKFVQTKSMHQGCIERVYLKHEKNT